MIELTVLGAAGSYFDPKIQAPCSGYLVRTGEAMVMLDCGYGTLAQFCRSADLGDLDAVLISHVHPDHCGDFFNLNTILRTRASEKPVQVLCPAGVREQLQPFSSAWYNGFDWSEINDGQEIAIKDSLLRFSITDHGPPTAACLISSDGASILYTADTGPAWAPSRLGMEPDLLLCEASYLDKADGPPVHLSAREAGVLARAIDARALMLTHLSPGSDSILFKRRAEETFESPVLIAEPGVQAVAGDISGQPGSKVAI